MFKETPVYRTFHIEVGTYKRKRPHCSLCRRRQDYIRVVQCELPPQAKRGTAGGMKELRLCTECLRIIRKGAGGK